MATTTNDKEAGNDELLVALEASLRLQSHYAFLLNTYDGGARAQFASAEEWIARLKETQTLVSSQAGLIPQSSEDSAEPAVLGVEDLIELISTYIYNSYTALEDSEETVDGIGIIQADDYKVLCASLEELNKLPDKPGYICGPAAKVSYALKTAFAALGAFEDKNAKKD